MWLWQRMRHTPSDDDGFDPAVARLLASSMEPAELDARHLVRARIRIDALLHEAPPRGGLVRRLGPASLGGGGMWAGLIGAAAAHKAAAAAVGLSVLVGGTVVETTGVGPAVRDAVTQAVTQSDGDDENIELVATATAEAEPTEEPNAAVSLGEGNRLPGNLVTHVREDGSFQFRAEIVEADGTVLTLLTADGELEVDVAEADVHTTGNPADAVEWADYVDYGVFVTGTCTDEEPAELLTECATIEVERVQLLGRAGRGGQPEGAGQPEGVGQPQGVTTQSEDRGAREGAGRPDDVPPAGRPAGVARTPTRSNGAQNELPEARLARSRGAHGTARPVSSSIRPRAGLNTIDA